MKIKERDLAIIAIIAAALIGGGTGVLTKIAERDVSANFFSFLRFFVASGTLLPFLLTQKIKLNRDFLKLVLISLFASGNIIFFSNGIKLTTANIGSVMYVITPAIVAILSYFLLRDKLSLKKVLGLIFGLAGGLLIILLPIVENGVPFSGNLVGNILVGIAVFSFAFYSVFSKNLQKIFSPIQITAVFCITTFFVSLFLLAGETSTLSSQIQHISHASIISIIYVSLFSTIGVYFLYQYAIKHGSPLLASTMLYFQPLSTFVWSFLILGEKLTSGLIIGGIAVVVGTLLISSRN